MVMVRAGSGWQCWRQTYLQVMLVATGTGLSDPFILIFTAVRTASKQSPVLAAETATL